MMVVGSVCVISGIMCCSVWKPVGGLIRGVGLVLVVVVVLFLARSSLV